MANRIGDSRILSLTEEELEDDKRVMDIRSRKRIINGPTFEFCMLTESEVKESLAALNPNKSAGYDKIFTTGNTDNELALLIRRGGLDEVITLFQNIKVLSNKLVIGVLSTDLSKVFDSLYYYIIRFTAAIIGEAEGIWFLRRSYRSVKVVFLRKNK